MPLFTVLTEAGGEGIDDARIDGSDGFVFEFQALQGLDTVVGNQYICTGDQFAQDFIAGFGFEIQRDTLLVAVVHLERVGHVGYRQAVNFVPVSIQITGVKGFDLDHFRPKICQHHTGRRRKYHRGNFNYTDVS